MNYRILPPEELIEDGLVALPPSKSILNRRFVLDALTPGPTPLAAYELPPVLAEAEHPEDSRGASFGSNAPDAADVVIMRDAVEALPFREGSGTVQLNCGASASALRFLIAYCAVNEGTTAILTGLPRLLERPVAPLVDALRSIGGEVEYLEKEGCAPLKIVGKKLDGGVVGLDATLSSQFASALMMVAPTMTNGLRINFEGEVSSLPYIKMTAAMMRRRGIELEVAPLYVEIPSGEYHATEEVIEADWSAAAFWYEITALTAGWISLNLTEDSIQGDARAREFFEQLGVLTEPSEDYPGMLSLSPSPEVFGRLDLDLTDYPDLAPALAVSACMLNVPFKFVGLKNLSIKESDRLQAIVDEMDKVGCIVEKIRDYGLEYEGKRHPIAAVPEFDPRGDHRLAMALAPVAAYIPGIVLNNADCVDKSYPAYWDNLRSLGFTLLDPSEPIPEPEEEETE